MEPKSCVRLGISNLYDESEMERRRKKVQHISIRVALELVGVCQAFWKALHHNTFFFAIISKIRVKLEK